MKADKQKIGIKIRHARIKFKLSQNKLSQKIGYASSSISQWENGKKYPSFQAIKALQKILKINL